MAENQAQPAKPATTAPAPPADKRYVIVFGAVIIDARKMTPEVEAALTVLGAAMDNGSAYRWNDTDEATRNAIQFAITELAEPLNKRLAPLGVQAGLAHGRMTAPVAAAVTAFQDEKH